MKDEIKYIDDNKVTITNEPCDYLEETLSEEIDFSKLKQVENPFKRKPVRVMLDPDIAKHFKSSKHLNQFLRLHLKSMKNIGQI